jgi:two-component system, response regulator PdtaR
VDGGSSARTKLTQPRSDDMGTARKLRHKMAQYASPHRRALIIEDEIVIALGLQDAMSAMGFDHCDIASSDQQARSLAMGGQPDVALVDVSLEGGREGIEAARWLREVCDVPIVFVTGYTDPDTIDRIHQQVPGAPVIPKPDYRRGLAHAVDDAIAHKTGQI